VQVRRGMVAQDGFDKLGEVDLRAPIEITFIDQFGQGECSFSSLSILLWPCLHILIQPFVFVRI
jgi:hypothetical protein